MADLEPHQRIEAFAQTNKEETHPILSLTTKAARS